MEDIQEGTTITAHVDELLKDVPIESDISVDLPSKGKFYSSGNVTVIPITLGIEKNLAKLKNKVKNQRELIKSILKEVIKDVEVDEILLVDKITILFQLRRVSFGDLIKFDAPCIKCNTINSVSFKITELPMDVIPDSYQEVNELFLPNSGLKVWCRLPRIRDEESLDGERVLSNLFKFVSQITIKEDVEITDPMVINEILGRLIAGDTIIIIDYLSGKNFGYQTTVQFHCSDCNQVNVVQIPLGEDFL